MIEEYYKFDDAPHPNHESEYQRLDDNLWDYIKTHKTVLMADTDSWKLLRMAVVVESGSSWTAEGTGTMVDRANIVLSQCKISLVESPQTVIYLGSLAMDYDSIGVANEFYKQFKTPLLFLVEATQYNGSAGWAPGSNYLFISSYSLSDNYQKIRNPEYEILAHELGHMLGGLQHLSDEKNLMAGYIANQTAQLTREQCQSMRASVHLNDENLF
jgi:hypothetical protein